MSSPLRTKYRVEQRVRGKWVDAGLEVDAVGTSRDGMPETFATVSEAEDALSDHLADCLADGRRLSKASFRVAAVKP